MTGFKLTLCNRKSGEPVKFDWLFDEQGRLYVFDGDSEEIKGSFIVHEEQMHSYILKIEPLI